MLLCRNTTLLHALVEDGVDEHVIHGAPEVVRCLLPRPLRGVSSELRRKNGHRIVGALLELGLLPLGFVVLIQQPLFYLLNQK